jgi:PEP-CTERM motif
LLAGCCELIFITEVTQLSLNVTGVSQRRREAQKMSAGNSTRKYFGCSKVLAGLATVILLSLCASATPITLNAGVSPQPANAGDGTIQAWLIQVINHYNTAHGTHLPTAPVAPHPDVKVNPGATPPVGYPSFGANTLSITLPANLNEYLVLHWGGRGGGVYQAFDLTTIPETSDTFLAPGRNGLSFYSFYGTVAPVPEPGTLALLGSGLLGAASLLRRRFAK